MASNLEIGLYGQSGQLSKGGGNSICQTERVNLLLLLELERKQVFGLVMHIEHWITSTLLLLFNNLR